MRVFASCLSLLLDAFIICLLLSDASLRQVAVIARVPLASGLLTGTMSWERIQKQLNPDDHRVFNRHGECFDKGETFSGLGGVLQSAALPAVEELQTIAVEADMSLVELALAFVLDCEGVSVVIPGCRNVKQVDANCAVALIHQASTSANSRPSEDKDTNTESPRQLSDEVRRRVEQVYDKHIRQHVHSLW
mgnify:CR=1 FL=1